jgi:putative heme-binding domain-containing protein
LNPRRPGNLRATALQLIPPGEEGREAARRALQVRPDARLLEAIVARLSPEGAGEASHAALAAALPEANQEQSVTLAAALARSESGAAELLNLAETGKISARLLVRTSVATALAHRGESLRSRSTAITAALPSESVRLDEVIAQRVSSYRPARTDPVNGSRVFAQYCAVCHHYRDTGGNVGPSLDGIGVRGMARLFEDILDPNRNIDPAFQRTTVTLKSGEELVGANFQSSADGATLTELGGKTLTIEPDKIATSRTDPVSIMPAVFEQSVAADDLGDVIAYLMSKE